MSCWVNGPKDMIFFMQGSFVFLLWLMLKARAGLDSTEAMWPKILNKNLNKHGKDSCSSQSLNKQTCIITSSQNLISSVSPLPELAYFAPFPPFAFSLNKQTCIIKCAMSMNNHRCNPHSKTIKKVNLFPFQLSWSIISFGIKFKLEFHPYASHTINN